jgi:hypothetical protein
VRGVGGGDNINISPEVDGEGLILGYRGVGSYEAQSTFCVSMMKTAEITLMAAKLT